MNRISFGHKMAVFGMGLVLLSGFLLAQDDPGDGPGPGLFDQAALGQADMAPEQEGVEPQAMGMIHEAFAVPAVFSANAGNAVPKEPPPPIEELPPDQKPAGDNVQWINGYFAYEDVKKDFYWVSGIWRNIPPSMEWIPGTWNQSAEGWQYYSGFWKRASEADLQVVPPPPAPLQTADPPSPGADSTYIPGTWIYRDTRYLWRPACWVPYRPGWVWVPGRYVATYCGWVFIDGYWDYVLADRGLLYCPVYVNAAFYRRPGWFYRPIYVVHDQCLLSCMFVNRGTGRYVFGNYYDDFYRRSGYVPWMSYRVNLHVEPLFSHYRYVNRNNARWETNLVALQAARYRGEAPRPPVTVLQQTTVIQKNVTQVNNLALIAPMSHINKKVVTLTKLDATQLQKHVQASKQLREASVLRAKNEVILAKSVGTVKAGDTAKPLSLNLPKTTQATVLTTKIQNLPPPPQGHTAQLPVGAKTIGTDKGITTKDKGPSTDKGVVVTKDKGAATDKGVATKDKGTVTIPKDKGTTTLPKDKGTPAKDKGATTDKGATSKDKDKGTPAKDKDKGTPAKDKDKGTKDKGAALAPLHPREIAAAVPFGYNLASTCQELRPFGIHSSPYLLGADRFRLQKSRHEG